MAGRSRTGLVSLLSVGLTLIVLRNHYFNQQTGSVSDLDTKNVNKHGYQVQTGYSTAKAVVHTRTNCSPDLSKARYRSQSNEDKALYDKFFSRPPLCGGVYVEIGALDGIKYSNTKFFETSLNWTGVLIEAQPQNAERLKKNRGGPNNVIIPEAVCQDGQGFVNFTGSAAVGGVLSEMTQQHVDRFIANKRTEVTRVPCRPIGVMLKNAGVTSVDFFILDVEGAELMVLETMDWSIPVRVFVVEMGRGDKDRLLIELLANHGYEKSSWDIRKHCLPDKDCANNQVFENIKFSGR